MESLGSQKPKVERQIRLPRDELLEETALVTSSQVKFIANYKTLSYILSIIVIIVGCLGLTGWIFNIPMLKSMTPGSPRRSL
jgi:hypothetical protein